MPRLRLTGTILVILGGVVFLVALTFLPYLSLHVRDALILRRTEPTLWDVTTREPVILTVLAVAAIGAAAGDLLSGERALLVLATGFSFYLLGRIFPLDIPDYGFLGAGVWVATSAAFTMSVGGVLAVAQWRFARPS
jgi:hypothetical protein